MIVDGHWVLLGSANWDVRSLRLNFELNVEAYGRHFAEEMGQVIQNKGSHSFPAGANGVGKGEFI